MDVCVLKKKCVAGQARSYAAMAPFGNGGVSRMSRWIVDVCVYACCCLCAGEPVGASPGAVQQSSSMAWRSSHNLSRTRMLELFSRVTGSGGGTGEALFNGLRVRMVSKDHHAHGTVSALGFGMAKVNKGWSMLQ
jgi:hypothetical protein